MMRWSGSRYVMPFLAALSPALRVLGFRRILSGDFTVLLVLMWDFRKYPDRKRNLFFFFFFE